MTAPAPCTPRATRRVLSTNFSPGGSTHGRKAFLDVTDGDGLPELPPAGTAEWSVVAHAVGGAESPAWRGLGTQSKLAASQAVQDTKAAITILPIPAESVAEFEQLDSHLQEARAAARASEAETAQLRTALREKVRAVRWAGGRALGSGNGGTGEETPAHPHPSAS